MSKLEKFKEQMQIELNANAHKGNWEEFVDPREILKELKHHENKMINAMYEDGNRELIKEYIADCANILMMLGNAYGLYD